MQVTQAEIDLARQALATVLFRIQRDENVRYHLGVATKTFGICTEAYARLLARSEGREPSRKDVDDTRDTVIPNSSVVHRNDYTL